MQAVRSRESWKILVTKAEERIYIRSSALIAWTEHSGIEFQEIDKVLQICLSSHCFHLKSILLQTSVFKHGILFQRRYIAFKSDHHHLTVRHKTIQYVGNCG
jgi:hypothetical protein